MNIDKVIVFILKWGFIGLATYIVCTYLFVNLLFILFEWVRATQ